MGVGASRWRPPRAGLCALLPDLVCAVASLGVDRPYGVRPRLSSGMARTTSTTSLFLSDPVAPGEVQAGPRRVSGSHPNSWRRAGRTLLSGADLAAAQRRLAEYMVSSMKDGSNRATKGWWDDACADRRLGVRLRGHLVPCSCGTANRTGFVPFQHGSGWLPDPRRRGHLTQADGHLTLLDHVPEVPSGCLKRSRAAHTALGGEPSSP